MDSDSITYRDLMTNDIEILCDDCALVNYEKPSWFGEAEFQFKRLYFRASTPWGKERQLYISIRISPDNIRRYKNAIYNSNNNPYRYDY